LFTKAATAYPKPFQSALPGPKKPARPVPRCRFVGRPQGSLWRLDAIVPPLGPAQTDIRPTAIHTSIKRFAQSGPTTVHASKSSPSVGSSTPCPSEPSSTSRKMKPEKPASLSHPRLQARKAGVWICCGPSAETALRRWFARFSGLSLPCSRRLGICRSFPGTKFITFFAAAYTALVRIKRARNTLPPPTPKTVPLSATRLRSPRPKAPAGEEFRHRAGRRPRVGAFLSQENNSPRARPPARTVGSSPQVIVIAAYKSPLTKTSSAPPRCPSYLYLLGRQLDPSHLHRQYRPPNGPSQIFCPPVQCTGLSRNVRANDP